MGNVNMEFNIHDGTTASYQEMKEAYLSGVRGKNLRKQFGIGTSRYKRLLDEFRADGIIVPKRGRTRINKPVKNYYFAEYGMYRYWVVKKTINNTIHHFGHYKSEAEAQKRVQELKSNHWNGLLKE